MHILKNTVAISILINIIISTFFNTPINGHILLESLLCGLIVSIITVVYNKTKMLNKTLIDNLSAIEHLKQDYNRKIAIKQGEIKELRHHTEELDKENIYLKETIDNTVSGDIYYYTKGGNKFHRTEDCSAIKDIDKMQISLHPVLMSVLNHSGKMCMVCALENTHYNGVEIYYTPSGSLIYTSKDAISLQHRPTATSSIISKNEFFLLKSKFPDIVREFV